jgi:SAM-dependent methyltransferase
MFNRLHARLHRPENGWDPVPAAHAASYGAGEWSRIDQALLDDLSQRIGGFAGKSVLDLGGGPGQYSAAIAQRGARVTWHDVSRTYLNMSKSRAEALGLLEKIKFSLGYLDEAPRLLGERFDFVFNRICWYYAFGDRSLPQWCTHSSSPAASATWTPRIPASSAKGLSSSARLRTWLNDRTAIKIGHPYPPRGRLARLFLRHEIEHLSVDYRTSTNDRILFQRAAASP